MTIDERTRYELRQWFAANMNERLADAMMEAMPAADHDELATRTDLAGLRAELHADMADLRGEFAKLRGEFAELRGEFAELRGEFGELRGDFGVLQGEMHSFRGEMLERLATLQVSLTRWFVAMQITTIGVVIAYVSAVT